MLDDEVTDEAINNRHVAKIQNKKIIWTHSKRNQFHLFIMRFKVRLKKLNITTTEQTGNISAET